MSPTIYQRHQHRPDVERPRVRALVDAMQGAAHRANGDLAELIAEAAATLDSYQAGLILATPHALTGWRLAPAASAEHRDAYALTEQTGAATDLNNALGAAA